MAETDEKIVKKPAHEVVVEMIKKTVEAINMSQPTTATQLGMLAAELKMLVRMLIPEKHLEEVRASLRQIKENCSLACVEQLLPNAIFLAIDPSPKNPIVEFFIQGGDFSSEEGKKLINNSKASDIAEAAKNPEVMRALIYAMDRGAIPYFRRNVMAGLAEDNSVGMS